jgi:hypothetical protein
VISRRGFFGLVAGAAVVEIIKPKLYVFAPQGGWNHRTDLVDLRNWVKTPNPLSFYKDMPIAFYNNTGGEKRGSTTVTFVDPKTNTIWLSSVLPNSIRKGDLIILPSQRAALNSGQYYFDGSGVIDYIEETA